MGWSKRIAGSYALHNVGNVFVNVDNTISNFVESNPATNITTNNIILIQYIITQGL